MHPEAYSPLEPTTSSTEAVSLQSLAEGRVLRRAHPNVLLFGARAAITLALDDLRSSFELPVVNWRAGDRVVLPRFPASGTLVLEEVDALSRVDQQRLFRWLQNAIGKVQVVSTTQLPLFQLVERGMFLDTLFYQLNVVYLEVAL